MTREQLAEKLNGREYRNEITKAEEQEAKESNLLVIFGASDDLIEFRGAIHDEGGGYEGGKVLIAKKGSKFDWHDEELDETVTRTAKEDCFYDIHEDQDTGDMKNVVEAVWSPEALLHFNGVDHDFIAWIYKTDIPNSKFIIIEDDGVYCQGIVINMNELI